MEKLQVDLSKEGVNVLQTLKRIIEKIVPFVDVIYINDIKWYVKNKSQISDTKFDTLETIELVINDTIITAEYEIGVNDDCYYCELIHIYVDNVLLNKSSLWDRDPVSDYVKEILESITNVVFGGEFTMEINSDSDSDSDNEGQQRTVDVSIENRWPPIPYKWKKCSFNKLPVYYDIPNLLTDLLPRDD